MQFHDGYHVGRDDIRDRKDGRVLVSVAGMGTRRYICSDDSHNGVHETGNRTVAPVKVYSASGKSTVQVLRCTPSTASAAILIGPPLNEIAPRSHSKDELADRIASGRWRGRSRRSGSHFDDLAATRSIDFDRQSTSVV